MKEIKFYSTHGEYGFMSNFARYEIKVDGKIYQTTEHYFQSQKFIGTQYESKVRAAKGPKLAASLGRDRSFPLRKDWESVKDNVMRKAVCCKFKQHLELQTRLLATGDALLIEDTSTSGDVYWGKVNGVGKNMLGAILMETRAQLRKIHEAKRS
jgi:hypothetical protein